MRPICEVRVCTTAPANATLRALEMMNRGACFLFTNKEVDIVEELVEGVDFQAPPLSLSEGQSLLATLQVRPSCFYVAGRQAAFCSLSFRMQ
jgi:hypothetical protein